MIKFGLKYLARRTNPSVPAAEVKAMHRKVLDYVKRSYRATYRLDSVNLVYSAANEVSLLWDAYGVEFLKTKKGHYYYVNCGDTYTPTIIFPLRGSSRKAPFVSSWGDVVEEEGSVD